MEREKCYNSFTIKYMKRMIALTFTDLYVKKVLEESLNTQ
jgi:hypothetical protein